MTEKLDQIIELLKEINETLKKLVPANDVLLTPSKPRRKSKKQLFHEQMLVELGHQYAKDKLRAEKKFASKYAELVTREKELTVLKEREKNLNK